MTMNPLEIFMPGQFRDMSGTVVSFSDADLKASADAYDPRLSQAPLVVGHPETNHPAYGQVKALAFNGKRLLAEPENVEPAFAELVNSKRFNRISASFYTKESPDNPKPGVFYLRHVGFLGAVPPALKGLKPPVFKFKENEKGVISFEFSENDPSNEHIFLRFIEWFQNFMFRPKDPPPAQPGSDQTTKKEETTSMKPGEGQVPGADDAKRKEADFAQKENSLNQRETDLEKREKDLEEKEAANRRTSFAEFIDGLIKEGKVLPVHKDGLVNLLATIPENQTFEFSEGSKKTVQETLTFVREFLKNLPNQVHYREVVSDEDPHKAGDALDPKDIARRAQAYQNEEAKKGIELSFAECVRHVTKTK